MPQRKGNTCCREERLTNPQIAEEQKKAKSKLLLPERIEDRKINFHKKSIKRLATKKKTEREGSAWPAGAPAGDKEGPYSTGSAQSVQVLRRKE